MKQISFALLLLLFFSACKKTIETTPSATIPSITTIDINSLTQSAAKCGGNINSDGGAPISERGVCWVTTLNPTIGNNKTNDGSGTGNFTSSITGLNANTTYHVRAYATNSVGTAYGRDVSFTTGGTGGVIDIDGNVYDTVTIGTQVWMRENLKTSHYRNGDAILRFGTALAGQGAWNTMYPDDDFNSVYGKLYNFDAVDDPRGLAPQGWHIPSDDEWTTLVNYLGGDAVAGGKMKSTNLWQNPNTGATNSSGFTGLPAGIYYWFDSYDTYGFWGYWYSSTNGWYRELSYQSDYVTRAGGNSGDLLSVRCIKD